MMLYGRGMSNKEIQPIDLSSIQFLTQQLERVIKLYEDYVLLRDIDKDNINELKQYLDILESKRYDMLVADVSLIHDDVNNPYEEIDECL